MAIAELLDDGVDLLLFLLWARPWFRADPLVLVDDLSDPLPGRFAIDDGYGFEPHLPIDPAGRKMGASLMTRVDAVDGACFGPSPACRMRRNDA